MSDSTSQTPSPPKQAKSASNLTWRGNRYPSVKLRGYYSDVLSKENIDRIGVSMRF